MKGIRGLAPAMTLALTLMTSEGLGAQTPQIAPTPPSGDSVVVRVWSAKSRAKIRARIDSLKRELAQANTSDERVRIGREINRQIELLSGDSWDNDGRMTYSYDSDAPMAMSFMKMASDAAAANVVLRMSPRGWIGLNMEAPSMQKMTDSTMTIRYFEYPEIVSVDVNSPAERAGVERGDVLIAFNGDDVREREIDMSKLLVPGRKITLKLRRDDDTKLLPVVVAPVPQQVRNRRAMTWVMRPDPMPSMPAVAPMPSMAATPAMPAMPRTPVAAMPGMAPAMWDYARAPIAGAQVAAMSEGLTSLTGVQRGVFIVDVAPGSPAQDAGLRAGDVVTAVNGSAVLTISQFRNLLQSQDDDSAVRLTVVRAHKSRTIVLSR